MLMLLSKSCRKASNQANRIAGRFRFVGRGMAGHPWIQETEGRKEENFHGLGFGLGFGFDFAKVQHPNNTT